MIETTAITSLDDVDFDRLFDDSYQHLAVDFIWGHRETYEDRKAHLRHLIECQLAGKVPAGTTGLVTKTSEDGHDLALSTGVVLDGHYTIYVGLVAKNASGSRAYLYTPEFVDAFKAFYAANGITSRSYEVVADTAAENMLLNKRSYVDTAQTLREGAVKIVSGD